jgi:ribonuclease PH
MRRQPGGAADGSDLSAQAAVGDPLAAGPAATAATGATAAAPAATAATGGRSYGRVAGALRPVAIEPGFVRTATGSALISAGETRVICTASVQEGVPRWLAGQERGWLTAEYGMLPASTGERKARDISKGRLDGRSVEIQRLIGRSLRSVIDLGVLGERTIYLDCDVLQADGGTRCAAITGAYVALGLACAALIEKGLLERSPLTGSVAAVSCGIVDGRALLDLDYGEDSRAEVDANVVMTGDGALVEVQATAERTPLSRAHLDELLALAADGIKQLRRAQKRALGAAAGG